MSRSCEHKLWKRGILGAAEQGALRGVGIEADAKPEVECPLSPGENVLGRDEEVNVRIDAPSVSRRHALITIVPGEPAKVADLGSKNGTWVSGRRIEGGPTPLADGDALRLGKVALLFLDSKKKGSTQTFAD
jgi:hypothetical protein